MKPLVIDLYCGLGGWSKGFLSEGYDAVGFDIERHSYGDPRFPNQYPGDLVLQDTRTLHGSQFKDAAAIVASPPCQRYSRMAMPFSRGKREAAAIRADATGAMLRDLNELFETCFRLQREASEAAGRRIPLVVENVKGAQPWVGKAKAHFGSFYLWGDVESVGGRIVGTVPTFGDSLRPAKRAKIGGAVGDDWFVHHNRDEFLDRAGVKTVGHVNIRDGFSDTRHLTNQRESTAVLEREGTKQRGSGAGWFREPLQERRREATATKNGGDWFGPGEDSSLQRKQNSRSDSRKAASAMIAEIPFELASYIARILKR